MNAPSGQALRPPLDIRVAGVFESVAMALLIGLVLSIFYAVCARELFRLSVPWAEEVAAGLLAWTVMLGAAGAWARRRHIAIDMALRKMPLGLRLWLTVIIEVASVVLFVVIAKGSLFMMSASANSRTTALGISYTWLYLALFIGSTAMIAFSAVYLVRLMRDGRNILARQATDSEWTTS